VAGLLAGQPAPALELETSVDLKARDSAADRQPAGIAKYTITVIGGNQRMNCQDVKTIARQDPGVSK
jgi:hypothetical protein